MLKMWKGERLTLPFDCIAIFIKFRQMRQNKCAFVTCMCSYSILPLKCNALNSFSLPRVDLFSFKLWPVSTQMSPKEQASPRVIRVLVMKSLSAHPWFESFSKVKNLEKKKKKKTCAIVNHICMSLTIALWTPAQRDSCQTFLNWISLLWNFRFIYFNGIYSFNRCTYLCPDICTV